MRIKLSQEIHNLIRNLSKTEKAYFKKSTLSRTSSQLAGAFDIINSFEEFDDKAIAESLRAKGFEPKVMYKRLLPVLLKSLNQYNSGKSTNIDVKEAAMSAQILLDKNFHGLALHQIDKGIRIAKENEHWPTLVELLGLKRLAHTLEYDPMTQEDDLEYVETLEAIRQMENRVHYDHLWRKLIGLTKSENMERDIRERVVYEILEHASMKSVLPDAHQSFVIKNRVLGAANFLVGRWEEALESCKMLLNRIPDFEEGADFNNMSRLNVLHNLAHMQWATNDGKGFAETRQTILDQDHLIAKLPERVQEKLRIGAAAADQANALSSGALQLSIDKGMEIVETKNPVPEAVDRKAAMLGIAMAYFYREEYQKVISYINTVFLVDESQYLNDRARWLELLCLFEGDDQSLFEAKLLSWKRQLKKANSGYEWEGLILNALSKGYGKTDVERKEMFQQLFGSLSGFKNELRTRLAGALDLHLWAESKAVGRPMILLLKERYLK